MKKDSAYMSFSTEKMPLNQTLVIPVSKMDDRGITNLPFLVLATMNLVVAIDYDVPCFYIVKNRWGMDSGPISEIRTNPIQIQYLEVFLLKPDVFSMAELYQNYREYTS